MAMSGQVYNNHKEMPHRRHHAVPGSPTQHQRVQAQHNLHTHLSSTSAETPDEQSKLLLLHEFIKKLWNQLHQCLVLSVAVLFMMWQHFKALISLWCSISCQGQSKNKRNLSVNAEVNVLSYCSKKWKGEALCAMQMRKAYEDVYWKHNVKALQHVKEDNYCVFRAVLFKVFSQGFPFPGWMKEKDILKLPEKLLYSQGCNWIQQFSFGPEKYTGPKVYGKLRQCVEIFKNQWTDFYNSKDQVERNRMCKLVFTDETKENKLYEALKFIMLYLVLEAHETMKTKQHLPRFFHFLFSRDTSADPLSYMMNHLNSVGDTMGLEQAELSLLGYALEVKIKVFRLSKMDSKDFEIIYPEDYKREWHEITLMTEDDRHYNIPVIAK
ncbi:inactive ubiquitin thioesterase OTULINL [Mixophyes fleayi]|uniref:inactive ubiquitin thioesterase OTULINL n=1 Tax=Mixophyes fleayi TaxID=3061075 RepID=UPI003F4DFD44